MDLARFHFVVDAFIDDVKATAANENLQNLISHLSSVVNSPAQPQYIEQYKSQLEIFRQALSHSIFNNPTLEFSDFLNEFQLRSLVGNGLFDTVLSCIAENQLSSHSALTALQRLQSEFVQKFSHLQAINNALIAIGAPYGGEVPGDSEIEIKIPVEYETKTLNDLSREAKEWHRDLSNISEVFDPDRPEALVRTLSTGSWEFYLASTPLVIFGVAKCIKGIN